MYCSLNSVMANHWDQLMKAQAWHSPASLRVMVNVTQSDAQSELYMLLGLPKKHHQIQGSNDEFQVDIGRCKML